MSSSVTVAFSALVSGRLNADNMSAAMAAAAVPVDQDFLNLNALVVLSDSNSIADDQVTRTIEMALGPGYEGGIGATAVITPNAAQNLGGGAPIVSYTVTNAGSWYMRPPIVSVFDDTDNPIPGINASCYAELSVVSVHVVAGGTGYTSNPTVTASGGELAPGGKQATFASHRSGSSVSTVDVVTAGGPYNVPPTLAVTGGAGSGALLVAVLGISAVVGVNPGTGYFVPATFVTPFYQWAYPDGEPQQGSVVADFMQQVIQKAVNFPIMASIPVIA